MQTKLKQEFHQQEFAKWQNKGKNIEINNQVKQRLASLRQAAAINLQARRYFLPHLGKILHNYSTQRIKHIARKSLPCRKHLNRLVKEWPKELRNWNRKNKKEDYRMWIKDLINGFSKMLMNLEKLIKILKNLSLLTNAIFNLSKNSLIFRTSINVPCILLRINAFCWIE